MRNKTLMILGGSILVIAIVFGGIGYYQSTHFNSHVTINDTKVGGLTAEQAIKKLKSTILKNKVYVGNQKILDSKDTKAAFTHKDLPNVQKLLQKQRTLLPSSKAKNFALLPEKEDHFRNKIMKKEVEQKLLEMNKSLKAPKDAQAYWVDGKIMVSKSKPGNQYDVARLLKDYQKQEYNSEIHLNPVYIEPVKENSPTIQKEKQKLQELMSRTVDYVVQEKPYPFKASELIKKASVSKNMKISVDPEGIKNKTAEINRSQSTLGKNYTFKTHSGRVISVKGQSYGWALDVNAETKRIQDAFESGKKSLKAYNVYGIGWNINGIGYHTTMNHGIGDTYAEVSIKDQQIWIYKNGQLKISTHVVTGRHNTHEDTPTGVWYIHYKKSPSILRGSEAGNPNYSVKVQYWAPFTLGGVGFHDAGWRSNWKSNAYLTAGSGGCVNIPPDAMKVVYDNLEQYEPVIVY